MATNANALGTPALHPDALEGSCRDLEVWPVLRLTEHRTNADTTKIVFRV